MSKISEGVSIGFIPAGENLLANQLVILTNLGTWQKTRNTSSIGLYGVTDNTTYRKKYRIGYAASVRIIGIIQVRIVIAPQDYSADNNFVTAGVNGLAEIRGNGQRIGLLTRPVAKGDTTADITIFPGLGLGTGEATSITASEVKSLYESNSDTNAFTDALLNKLNTIESGATADQVAAEVPISSISALPSTTNVQTALQGTNDRIDGLGNFGVFRGTYNVQDGNVPSAGTINAGDFFRVFNAGNTGFPFGTTGTIVNNGDILLADKASPTLFTDFTIISTDDARIADLITRLSTTESKLSTIEQGAEVNPTDGETKTAYEANPDTNPYTDAEQTKLTNIPNPASVTEASLIGISAGNSYTLTTIQSIVDLVNDKSASFPAYKKDAIVDPAITDSAPTYEIGSLWFNTANTSIWICQDATAGAAVWYRLTETDEQVKQKYEANADTNAFSDILKNKLVQVPIFGNENNNKIILIGTNTYSAITIAQLQNMLTPFKYQMQDDGVDIPSLGITKLNFSTGIKAELCGDSLVISVTPGGIGSGGHIIVDSDDMELPQRDKLQFRKGFAVFDDLVDNKSIVDVTGDPTRAELEEVDFEVADWVEGPDGTRLIDLTHNLGTINLKVGWYEDDNDGQVFVPWQSSGINSLQGCIKATTGFKGLIRITSSVEAGASTPNIIEETFTTSKFIETGVDTGIFRATFDHGFLTNAIGFQFFQDNGCPNILCPKTISTTQLIIELPQALIFAGRVVITKAS